MSRSGYTNDGDDNWALIRWRGAVNRALTGARGQAFLRELLAALDAMPEKSLVSSELESGGEFCALGVVGRARGIDLTGIDTEDWQQVSDEFGIAGAMAREIMWENDECVMEYEWRQVEICGPLRSQFDRHKQSRRVHIAATGERRWNYMRNWALSNLKNPHIHAQGASDESR